MMLHSKNKYSEDNYSFASVKISCLSTRLPSEKDILSFCTFGTSRRIREKLIESGFLLGTADTGTEELLSSNEAGMFDSLSSFLPDRQPLDILRTRYDCHNIKTAIKCAKAGLDASPYCLPGGTFSIEDICRMTENREFSVLPKTVSAAAAAALEASENSAATRAVDTLLDRACFDRMKELSDSFGCNYVSKLLGLKADITNLMTVLRIRNIKNTEKSKALLSDSFVSGGLIPPYRFIQSEDRTDCVKLLEKEISQAHLELLLNEIRSGAGNDRLSSVLDSIYLSEGLTLCGDELLGIAPVLSYILQYEYIIKNIRIISSGIDSGKGADDIRGELRVRV